MKRVMSRIGVVLGVAVIVAMTAYTFVNAASADEMVGVVAVPARASIDATAQLGALETLHIERVVAPDDSWVAVYLVGMGGMPGALVGYESVPPGETLDVVVDLDTDLKLTEDVLVVLQADRGVRSRFEFDAARFDSSPDKPYFVDGVELSVPVKVRFFDMANSVSG